MNSIPQNSSPSPEEIARRSADLMWADDHAARGLGMEILDVGPGTARVAMTVRQDMVNSHGTCHGGFLFACADVAFAYACNSQNHRAVASGADMSFIAPAHLGDRLIAHGRARQQGSRSGVYDIEVENQHGKLIALFRGRAARIKGHFFEMPDNPAPSERETKT